MLEGTVTSDSDLVAELIAAELAAIADREALDAPAQVARGHIEGGSPHDAFDAGRLEAAVASVVPRLEGAFSLVIMDEPQVIGVRDPHGFRPLCLGRLECGAGCWRRRRRRSTSSAPTSSASSSRARWW